MRSVIAVSEVQAGIECVSPALSPSHRRTVTKKRSPAPAVRRAPARPRACAVRR